MISAKVIENLGKLARERADKATLWDRNQAVSAAFKRSGTHSLFGLANSDDPAAALAQATLDRMDAKGLALCAALEEKRRLQLVGPSRAELFERLLAQWVGPQAARQHLTKFGGQNDRSDRRSESQVAEAAFGRSKPSLRIQSDPMDQPSAENGPSPLDNFRFLDGVRSE